MTILKKPPWRHIYVDGDKQGMLPFIFPDHASFAVMVTAMLSIDIAGVPCFCYRVGKKGLS